MEKKPLIVGSLCAVVFLVLGSLSNVVGYQTIQSSNQSVINERIDQRELLFQTIVDITNNKEIQRIILKSQMSRGIFPTSEIPVVTKNQLKVMYFIGLILSKIISKSKMQSMVQHQVQLMNPKIQQETSAIIENNPILKGEITQLQNSECDCENEKNEQWTFPIICNAFLLPLAILAVLLCLPGESSLLFMLGNLLAIPIVLFAMAFHCRWLS